MAWRAKNSELPDATITISDRLFSPLILIFCYKKRPVPTLLRIFIDFWLANMCFSNVQNILQSSPDGNVTLSILNYVPSIRDAGKYMACRAENSELPDATLEDGWKLEIHCN